MIIVILLLFFSNVINCYASRAVSTTSYGFRVAGGNGNTVVRGVESKNKLVRFLIGFTPPPGKGDIVNLWSSSTFLLQTIQWSWPSIYWLPWYFCLDWLSTLYYIRLLAIFSKVHNYVQGFYVMHFQLVFFFPFLNNNVKNGTTTSTQFRGSINQQGQTQTEEMIDIHICSNFRWTNNNDDEGCHKYPLKLDVDLQQIATKLEHHSMH